MDLLLLILRMTARVANKMVEMRASQRLNLPKLENRLKGLPQIHQCHYRAARPCRLYLK